MDTQFRMTLLSTSSGYKFEALPASETSERVYQSTRHNLQYRQTCYSTPRENLTIRARCFDTWLCYLLQVIGCRYTRTAYNTGKPVTQLREKTSKSVHDVSTHGFTTFFR